MCKSPKAANHWVYLFQHQHQHPPRKKNKKHARASAGSATERKWEEEEDGNGDEKAEEETSGSGLLGGLKRILFSKKAHTVDGAVSPRTIASYTNSTQHTSSSQLISSASTSPTATHTIKTLHTTSSPATTTTSKVPPLPLRHVPEDSQQTTIEHDDYDDDPISITETHVAKTSITPAMYQSRTRERRKHGERPSMSRSITQKKESITQTAAAASAPVSLSTSVHASPSTETRELTSPTSTSISSPTAAQVNFVQLAVRHPQQQLKRTTSSFLPSRTKKFATVPSSVLTEALISPTISDVLIPSDAPSANFKAITEEKEHTNPSHTRQCSVGANLSKHDEDERTPSPIPSEMKKHSATPIRYESDRLRQARAAAEQAAHEERLKEMHIIKSIFSILKKEEIEERIAEKEKQSHDKKSRSSHPSGIKHSPSISANSTGSNISVAMVNPDDREEDVMNKIANEEQRQHRMLDEIEALSPATKKEYLRTKRRQIEQAWTQHALDEFIRDQGLDKQTSPKHHRLQISPTHRQISPMNRHSPARARKSSPSPHRIKSHPSPSPHHLKTPTIRKAPSHFRFSPPATAQRHLHSPSITSTLYIHDDTDEMDSYILSEDIESFLDANKPPTPQRLPPKRSTLPGKGNKRASTGSPAAAAAGQALPMTALAHLISTQKSPPRHTPSPTSHAQSQSTFPSAKLSSIDDDHPYSTKSFSAVDGMDTGTDIETEDEFDAAIAEEEALQAEMDREEQQKMDDALRQEDNAYQRRLAMETERRRREQEMKDTKLRGSKMNLFKCVAEEAVRRVREKELAKLGKLHHRTESTAQKTAALVEMAQMAMVLYRQAQDASVPPHLISAMKQNKENSTRSTPLTITTPVSPTTRPKLTVNHLESPTRSASFSFSPTSLAQKMKQQMSSQMGPTTTKRAKHTVSKTHIQIKKRSPAITSQVTPNSPARCGTTEVDTARRNIIASVR